MKKRIKNTIKCIALLGFLGMCSVANISAKVTVNEAQATQDIKDILDPISNILMGAGLGLTLVSVGWSYLQYMGKDEDEKLQTPFVKTIKKHVIAFIVLGFVGAVLKWFTIS